MSLAIAFSRTNCGINALLVTVEVHITGGLPQIAIVGLPEKAVKESKDRVRSALLNMNFNFPPKRITINLAPADLPKEGGRFDLAIAAGILAATKQLPANILLAYELVGELALSGQLRPVKGILSFALATKKRGKKLIVPYENAKEAALVKGLEIYPATHFLDVCSHLLQRTTITPLVTQSPLVNHQDAADLYDVIGQPQARRALEIAAAGKHSLLFIGPPGSGKTMLASRLTSILPAMTESQALQVATIASMSHKGFNLTAWKKRPLRAPHHSASSIALVGGGNPPKPGEISLAHQGVLFLDELAEFSRGVLEALREPLESGIITISRAAKQVEFPANFQLIAAMNPCPCGFLGDSHHVCRCSSEQVRRYRHKISGPLLDRIDMCVMVPRLTADLLLTYSRGESSATVKSRVEKARIKQQQRASKLNSELTNKEIKRHCALGASQLALLNQAIEKFKLSARAYHRLLKIARTIADLADSDTLQSQHLNEALNYRYINQNQ